MGRVMSSKFNFPVWLICAAVILLSACGQRPESTTGVTGGESITDSATVFGPNGEVLSGGGDIDDPELGAALADALTLRVISDVNNVPTSRDAVANVTVLITDESNRAKAEQEVEFSSSGGVLQSIVSVTDINGEASATLNLGQDFRNQNIIVTALAGNSFGSVQVSTSGSSVEISGQELLIAGDTAELIVTMADSTGDPIANEEIIFTSAAGNTITPSTVRTDANGLATIEVTSDLGSDTITALALDGTAVATHSIGVANDILTFVAPAQGQEVAVGDISEITVLWESGGAPVIGGDLRFGLTAGQLLGNSIVTTDANGEASIQITSSSAGPATVSVEAVAGGDPAAQLEFEFVATTPAAINLATSSTRVSTGDTSTLVAAVTDLNGNPVKNTEVIFSSSDLRGGQINPASAISNSDGVATVTFTAGTLATEFEAIQILAQVINTSIVDDTNLTAVDRVLNVTIGSTDLIREINGETQYSLPFVVQVADGGGSPLENATVEVSVRPLTFSKGMFRVVNANGLLPEELAASDPDANFSGDRYALRAPNVVECVAEDVNGNRILDVGEDINNNGSLDPQDPAVVAADSVNEPTIDAGSITTDATGSGFFAVIYPQSNAMWSTLEITARARALGAEAEASFRTILPVTAEELNDVNTGLPNQVSPYGSQVTGDPVIDCANTL